ncbi:transposase [Schaalia hyovaginalis]|uniref:Transposase-like protein n=1 Tax=Schaalia hyovaginalis TaxID=29316 RepID=A0A923E7E5_9ACTO|nr:transposase-like protein [Schaalia hyovaginalis]
MLTDAEADLTAFATLTPEHWQKVWSNTPIERLKCEIKRRADLVQIFPDRQPANPLIGAVLLEQHKEWQYGEHRYFSDTPYANSSTPPPTSTKAPNPTPLTT